MGPQHDERSNDRGSYALCACAKPERMDAAERNGVIMERQRNLATHAKVYSAHYRDAYADTGEDLSLSDLPPTSRKELMARCRRCAGRTVSGTVHGAHDFGRDRTSNAPGARRLAERDPWHVASEQLLRHGRQRGGHAVLRSLVPRERGLGRYRSRGQEWTPGGAGPVVRRSVATDLTNYA